MKKNIRVSLFLLLVMSLFTLSGLAQSSDPQPPGPHKTATIGDSNQGSLTLDGTLVINSFDASSDNRIGFVRNVARSLLQTEQISVVYRTEGEASALSKLSDGDTAAGEVRYHKLAFASIEEGFFDGVKDFLVTDGKKYFRILLGKTVLTGSSDIERKMVER